MNSSTAVPTTPTLRFPDGFLWGAATAAYQVEGSPLADGAGPSIWHTFAHTPGVIAGGDHGDVACDHYHRYREDVALMADLGLKAYRFSIAWPRIVPTAGAAANEPGLAFYDRLVDCLLEAGIEPMPTLYHWDLPQWCQDLGGWASPDMPGRFADYVEAVLRRLGDRVRRWTTFNEPWVFLWVGSVLGVHAPGEHDLAAALAGGHHVLRAHGEAVRRIRRMVPGGGEAGIVLSVQAHMPASNDPRDAAAAARMRAFQNEWFADAIFRGEYPAALRDQFGDLLPTITKEDAALFGEPVDFVGINYYERNVHRHQDGGFFESARVRPDGEYTAMDWEVYPAGLLLVLREFHERYGVPLYVTENGAGHEEAPPPHGGPVQDVSRLRYLQSHLEMCHRAIAEGVDLRGYLLWTLMDNFEWAFGFAKRFGIVRCDFETLERSPKLSAAWYRSVIAANGL